MNQKIIHEIYELFTQSSDHLSKNSHSKRRDIVIKSIKDRIKDTHEKILKRPNNYFHMDGFQDGIYPVDSNVK